MLRTLLACALLFLAPAALAGSAAKDAFPTPEEALALAFGEATVEKSTFYLTEEQREAIEELAGSALASGIARGYVATDDEGERVGVAWFDTHVVRSQRETLMTVVDPEGHIERVEVLAFAEPRSYLPKAGFWAQFQGKGLERVRLGRGVRNIAGATMSARAAVLAARRSLALSAVLFPAPEPEPEPEPEPTPRPKAGSAAGRP